MMKIFIYIVLILLPFIVECQSKYDFHWTIGYDTSLIDPGGDVVLIDFNSIPPKVQTEKTVERFFSFSSATTMSDADGKLIFYTSGCYIVNAANEIMANGDSINPGIIQQYDCPFGSSNNPGGAMAIPWPDSSYLYILLVNDYERTDFPGDPGGGCSRHLRYNVIDMNKDGGLGAVISKNQVLLEDSMSVNSIEACRHANGRDWWILTPKSHSNCYFITLVTPEGPGTPQKICTGIPYDKHDLTGQSCFTPDGHKFIRFNRNNGLHLYDFDPATGILSNEQWFMLNDLGSYTVGASVSPNSRYLYISAVSVLYQYDLLAQDILASQVLLAVPDNIPDPFVPSVFTYSALGPDGKIYISSGSTHLSLHIVHRPDCPGLYSLPERRGLALSSWNYLSVPNLPSFRNEPSNVSCDSLVVQNYTPVDGADDLVLFPNPARDQVTLYVNHPLSHTALWILYDQYGKVARQIEMGNNVSIYSIDLQDLSGGFYYYVVLAKGQILKQGKLVVLP